MQVKDLHVKFKTHKGDVHAVRGVSFEIKEKECVAIVGESGSGKSALAKSLVKLFPENATILQGEVIYQNHNLLAYTDKELRKIRGKEIGMVFQDPLTSLNPLLTIGFQIKEAFLRHFPLSSKKEAVAHTLELLDLVGIPNPEIRINEYPHTLSGGMRQRALIALALSAKPKLLIADEPTTALDVTLQAKILDLLKSLQNKLNMSILLITHDLSVVAGFCDKVLVMYGGKIVESGSVDSLFETPSHPYTKRLLLSKPRLDMQRDEPLVPIDGVPPDLSKDILGCAFCTRCTSSLKICGLQEPQAFEVREGHTSCCWLNKT